jgi:hypothetical protein
MAPNKQTIKTDMACPVLSSVGMRKSIGRTKSATYIVSVERAIYR